MPLPLIQHHGLMGIKLKSCFRMVYKWKFLFLNEQLTPHPCWPIFIYQSNNFLAGKRSPIMQESLLQTIEKEAAKLSLRNHLKLLETLARQLREKSEPAKQGLDWSELYGLGKGLWETEDAQEYVKRLREDRA